MPLPTPPSSADPANFAARADAFLGALPDFQVEMNQLEADVQGLKDDTETAVDAALAAGLANAAANATASQTARTGAETARTGAEMAETNAETARDVALQAAADAEAAAGVIPPVSGNAGKFLRVKADASGTEWAPAGVQRVIEYRTAGTSWTAPDELLGGKIFVRISGCGASGSTGSASTVYGLPGGSGAYSERNVDAAPGQVFAYALGVPGAAVSGTSAAGLAGGTTTGFGMTVQGGQAVSGTLTVVPAKATATGGDLNVSGSVGLGAGTAAGMPRWTTQAQHPWGTSPAISLNATARILSEGYGTGGAPGTPGGGNDSQAGRPAIIVLEYLVTA